jgi:glyoxylase-like metal-dependent hydrolase (beta-lactamase superfamily II)
MKLTDSIYFFYGVGFTCNSYFIEDEIRTLIDPGNYDCIENLLKDMKRDGLDPKKIDLIINTHTHVDHCGANQIMKDLSGAKIAVHRLEEQYLPLARETTKMFGLKMPEFKVDFYVENELSLGSLKLSVLHTPGHSPGSICLYNPKSRVLFSGDTVFSGGNVGRTDFPGGDPKQLVESIKRLCELDVSILCPGHMEIAKYDANRQIRNSLRLAQSVW